MATITSISNTNLATITPSGSQEVTTGTSVNLYIETDDLTKIFVEDNNIDVTDQLVRTIKPRSGATEQYATGYTSGGSISRGAEYAEYPVGYSAENPHTYSTNIYAPSSSTGYIDYSFDFSSIPSNATIDSIIVRCSGERESDTTDSTHMAKIGLYADSTLKSTEQEFTSTSQQVITITSPGTWTRAELQNAKLRFTVAYYGGKLFGITWIVNYSIPGSEEYWYRYTISNVTTNHTVIVQEPYIPPEEDPDKTYYPITISSINATTTPEGGTTRVESGASETITITPSDPQLTLALDNGIDITNQLVKHGNAPTSAITNITTNYGFTLNSDDFYESNNKGVSSSAAVARFTFNLPVSCLITFEYINYAESNYDFGIFGNIDSALSTSSSEDSDVKLSLKGQQSADIKTLTYNEISSGTHYIDVKYRKDSSVDNNNDSLQVRVKEITPLEPTNYYTYELDNINDEHSLIFIFGDVTYYFVESSVNSSNCKLYPNGQMVQLPGDNYKLTIVPENNNDIVTLTDNGTNVTSELERKEVESVKEGVTSITVNYIYRISNIQTGHTLSVVVSSASNVLYYKNNSNWDNTLKVYKKIDNRWIEQSISIELFNIGTIYINNNI